MASIRKRVDQHGRTSHQAQVRIKGSPAQTRTFATKKDANRWAQQVEADIRSGLYIRPTSASIHTVDDLLDQCETSVLGSTKGGVASNRAAYRFWRKHLGAFALTSVTPKTIEDSRDNLARRTLSSGKPLAQATILRYMMVLSRAFSCAINWQWCERNPVRAALKPRVSNKRVRYALAEERDRLLSACEASPSPDLYLAVVLAISTGMRRGEVMGMRWEDIAFDDRQRFARLLLSAQVTKNGTERSVLIASKAFDLLVQRREQTASSSAQDSRRIGLVFPCPANSSRPINLRAPWERALRAAKLSDFRFHDLRHTAASYMAMNGATTLEIKEALGHKSTAMAERYSHLSKAHVDSVILAMNERQFGATRPAAG